MSAERTYWNGEPATCRRVVVSVGTVPSPTWWSAGLEGSERHAVEVTYGGSVFFLDDDDLPEGHEELHRARLSPEHRAKMDALRRFVGAQPAPCRGDGWRKVTVGRGSPEYGHRSLPKDSIVLRPVPRDGAELG